VNIRIVNNEVFQQICINGDHFILAKWLHSFGFINITNIHANNNYASYEACRQVHLEVVQWLYRLGIVTDYAFHTTCCEGHFGSSSVVIYFRWNRYSYCV
jgi:hypothetical protein